MDNKAKIVAALGGGKAALGILGTSCAARLPRWGARRQRLRADRRRGTCGCLAT